MKTFETCTQKYSKYHLKNIIVYLNEWYELQHIMICETNLSIPHYKTWFQSLSKRFDKMNIKFNMYLILGKLDQYNIILYDKNKTKKCYHLSTKTTLTNTFQQIWRTHSFPTIHSWNYVSKFNLAAFHIIPAAVLKWMSWKFPHSILFYIILKQI